MKKRVVSLLLAGAMVVSLAACGGNSSSSTSSKSESGSADAGETAGGKDGTIELLNGKPEIDKQLQELAKAYTKETGVEVKVQTVGGSNQATASDTLKKDYQAGTMPDIFVAESNQFANWQGKLVDLSGEKWTANTKYAFTNDDGTVGFPCYIEAWGLGYNADVLEKAGVDPKSLTSPAAYEAAFKTIDAKKDELGLSEVVDYGANATELGWSTGTHMFGHYLDGGLADGADSEYFDKLQDGGQIDEARMKDFADFIALIQQYDNDKVATEGNYDAETKEFAQGKAAFITQGSWFGANLTANDDYKKAPFKCGIAPFAFEDGIDTICGGATGYWAVYKDGDVDEAKAFLQWCSEDEAQKMFVEDMGFVSPFSNVTLVSDDPFAAAVKEYMDAGKFSPIHTFLKKDGLQNKTGVVFQDFAAGKIKTSDDFVKTIGQVIKSYYAQ